MHLSKVCVKNDTLGIDLQGVDLDDILNNKLKCAIRNSQKANKSLSDAFDSIFDKAHKEKLMTIISECPSIAIALLSHYAQKTTCRHIPSATPPLKTGVLNEN